MDRSGGYCVTLVYPIPLLPSGPGGFFGLQLRSPPDLCSQAVSSLKRREWDSNPRWSYPHTRFPSVLLKPLGHLSDGSKISTLTFRLYHRFLVMHDDDRPEFPGLQDLPQVLDKLAVVHLAEAGRVLRKLVDRLGQLRAASIQVCTLEVMHADGSLHQSLVEKPERPPGLPPQVLPGFVRLEIVTGVEKIYSPDQEIGHR